MPKFYKKSANSQEKHFKNQSDFDTDPVKTLLSWTAPSRPFRKKDRSYYTTIAIIVTLLVLIALLAQEVLLIGVLLALAFVVYVLGFVPPQEVTNKISTQGVTIGDHFYFWQDLDSFWFDEKEGQQILNVLTQMNFPGVLIMPLGDQNEELVRKNVARFIPFREIAPKSMIDKWAQSLQKHFPLENPHR